MELLASVVGNNLEVERMMEEDNMVDS
jgi:hypothetical protein